MNSTINNNNMKNRISYLLAKYSLKVNQITNQTPWLPEPDNQYLDEDPNFLPFYGMV